MQHCNTKYASISKAEAQMGKLIVCPLKQVVSTRVWIVVLEIE